jgi:purine-nucleoside phosphorylase
MGCASIGIYSFELYTEYQVDCIIRLGTCGAYDTNSKVLDLINVTAAVSESSYAKYAWGIADEKILAQGNAISTISEMSKTLQYPIIHTAVHSSDIFYRKDTDIPAIATKFQCPVVEMESFALYANAQYLQKNAACLLTVSDIIPTHEKISPGAREKSLLPMITLALESAMHIAQLKA